MSTAYGSKWKINVLTGQNQTTPAELGGTVLDATIDSGVQLSQEVGSGEGRQLASQRVATSKPKLTFTMNIRRLTDYLLSSAIISEEGAVPYAYLAVSDGIDFLKLQTKANKTTITIKTSGDIQAKVEALIQGTPETIAEPTWVYRKDKSMFKNALSAFTIGSVDANTKWSEITIEIDNHVLQECLGQSTTPNEVQEQEAGYIITVKRAKSSTSMIGASLNGTTQTVVISLIDNQATPLTKTFTWADMLISSAKVEDKALGIVYETIKAEGKSLVVS